MTSMDKALWILLLVYVLTIAYLPLGRAATIIWFLWITWRLVSLLVERWHSRRCSRQKTQSTEMNNIGH